tara:strand:- start:554 stop:1006 length:453 start_codon:yes stop_codon:yes gene_type:complete
MKKSFLILVCVALFSMDLLAQTYEYQFITQVESIVAGGMGRSRIVHAKQAMDHTALTMSRVDGKLDKKKVKRSDARIGNFDETKILNFYSMVGLSFENIASNDAVMSSKLNTMSAEGWELFSVYSGVESDSGEPDGKGIFITRYLFRKKI